MNTDNPRFRRWVVSAAVGFCCFAFSPFAGAQSWGRVAITQKEPPENATRPELNRFIKRNQVNRITRVSSRSPWRMYMFVHLRFAPPARLLYLPQNHGQLHVVFYRRSKRRWVRDNVVDVSYKRGTKYVQFPFKITAELGLTVGVRYQIRVTQLNKRNREIVLAWGYFTLR